MSRNKPSKNKRDKTHAPVKTDAWMTIDPRPIPALLKHAPISPLDMVWECASGRGHMAGFLRKAGIKVYESDLIRYDAGCCLDMRQDFMKFDALPDPRIRSIITNPPNSLNIEFAMHAIDLMQPCRGVVALYQRHEWDTNQDSAVVFDHPAYAMKIIPRFRPRWVEPKPGEKPSSPFHKWSFYVWDWKHSGPPIIKFS